MNHTEQYARALIQASDSKDEKSFNQFFDNFLALLSQKKHSQLLPAILHKVKQLSDSQSVSGRTTLIVNDAKKAADFSDIVKRHEEVFGKDYDVVEDEDIIGGYVIRNRTHLLDGSYRTSLMKLYKKLIS